MEQATLRVEVHGPAWQPLPGHAVRVRGRDAAVVRVERSPGREDPLVDVVYTDGADPLRERLIWGLEQHGQSGLQDGTPLRVGPPAAIIPFRSAVRAARWEAPAGGLLDPELPVAPLTAAARLEEHQLVPLVKALSMPRVRLLLADGVGLGKTIEAGLVASELVMRRRVRRILVLCPPALREQWRREMAGRFGLELARLGSPEARALGGPEAAFRVLPRIIVSPYWLCRPENLAAFRRAVASNGEGGSRIDLLIVDEAHHFLPRPRGGDTDLVALLKELVPWSEHRLFLSATPHDGFRTSFTGLLEILDPLSFRRTSNPTAAERRRMGEVVIRRLDRDLRGAGRQRPRRRVAAWPVDLSPGEERLFRALREATGFLRRCGGGPRHCAPFLAEVLVKRLLSSTAAFASSFRAFEAGLASSAGETSDLPCGAPSGGDLDAPWLAAARRLGAFLARHHRQAPARFDEVSRALDGLQVERSRAGAVGASWSSDLPSGRHPDSRIDRLTDWIEAHLRREGRWIPGEKAVVFTTFVATAEAIVDHLEARWPGTNGEIARMTGATREGPRSRLLERFSDARDPLTVLVTTDVAAEGLNLQRCARYVFHHDVPWNPAVLEQRVGRLDRIGQEREVRSYHFVSRQSQELRLLAHVVRKAEAMEKDLGSIGEFIEARVRTTLAGAAPRRGLFPLPDSTAAGPPVCNVVSMPGLLEELQADARRRHLIPEAVLETFVEALTREGGGLAAGPEAGTWTTRGLCDSAPGRLARGADLVFEPALLPDDPLLIPAERRCLLVSPGTTLFSWMCARLARARQESLLWTALAGRPPGGASAAVLLFLTLWAENRLREPVAGGQDLLLLCPGAGRGGWGSGRLLTGTDPEVLGLADRLLLPGGEPFPVSADPDAAFRILTSVLPHLPSLVERRRTELARSLDEALQRAHEDALRELSCLRARRERELKLSSGPAARRRLERSLERLDLELHGRGFLFQELAVAARRRKEEVASELASRERRSAELSEAVRREESDAAERLPLRYALSWPPTLRLDALAILHDQGGAS